MPETSKILVDIDLAKKKMCDACQRWYEDQQECPLGDAGGCNAHAILEAASIEEAVKQDAETRETEEYKKRCFMAAYDLMYHALEMLHDARPHMQTGLDCGGCWQLEKFDQATDLLQEVADDIYERF